MLLCGLYTKTNEQQSISKLLLVHVVVLHYLLVHNSRLKLSTTASVILFPSNRSNMKQPISFFTLQSRHGNMSLLSHGLIFPLEAGGSQWTVARGRRMEDKRGSSWWGDGGGGVLHSRSLLLSPRYYLPASCASCDVLCWSGVRHVKLCRTRAALDHTAGGDVASICHHHSVRRAKWQSWCIICIAYTTYTDKHMYMYTHLNMYTHTHINVSTHICIHI